MFRQRLPWAWLFLLIIHLIGLILYLDFDQVLNNPPVVDGDYGLHWVEVWSVSHFLEDGRLWGYDPFFMAGHPEGTIFDIDNKLIEVASWLLSKSGISLPLSYNYVLLTLTILSPLAVYPAARWLTSNRIDAFIAQLAVLALWYFDPTLRWNWLGGTLAFACTVLLSLLLLASAVRLAENRMSMASWLVWWLLGPLLFWLHTLAFFVLCIPLVWLVLRGRQTFSRQQWLAFLLWPLLVVLVNLPWLITAVRFAWAKAPSDQFLQGGLPALAGDLLGQGRVDGASTVDRLGLRWVTLLVGGLGLWLLARKQRNLEPILVGVWMGLFLAYGGVYLPGGDSLQPYRYIDQAMIWAAVGLGSGLRALWQKLTHEVGINSRLTLRRGLFILATILVFFWVRNTVILLRPPRWDGARFNRWQGPSDESKAICNHLQTMEPLNGRILVDDTRLGLLLPWCSGVEVIGGPFAFIWTDYGYTNATLWTFLDTPYTDYTPENWPQTLHNYDVEWLLVNTEWGVPEWFTLSDWLALHPDQAEIGPTFGKFQFYKVKSYQRQDSPLITADHGLLKVQNAIPGQSVRLPYHWIPDLDIWPPNSATIQSEIVGNDPIPFIVVVPNQESFLICDPTGCPKR